MNERTNSRRLKHIDATVLATTFNFICSEEMNANRIASKENACAVLLKFGAVWFRTSNFILYTYLVL